MADTKDSTALAGLKANALSGRLNRRDFIQGALALGLGITAASGLWTREVAAATPKKSGTFRVGLDDGNTSDTLDPTTYNSRFMITMAHTRNNFLTEIGGDKWSPANSPRVLRCPRMSGHGPSSCARGWNSTMARRSTPRMPPPRLTCIAARHGFLHECGASMPADETIRSIATWMQSVSA